MSKSGAVDADRIRDRAYELWSRDGCPEGGALDYWLRAEAELAAQDPSESAVPVERAAEEPPPKPRAAKARSAGTRLPSAKRSPAKATLSEGAVDGRAESATQQRRTRKKAEG